MISLKMRRSWFSRFISFPIIFFLILGDPSVLIFKQSQNAYADPTDPYGFPIITGTPAGETKGSFAVSEKGSATYTIDLKVPPGTNGMQPNLSISYDSQGQNSYLGVGWNLEGLSAITRCPTTLAQDNTIDLINYNSNDKLCLDGQRLVVASGTYLGSGAEYRTENETFSKIVSAGTAGNGPLSFMVRLKNGLTYTYGSTTDSRVAHSNGNIIVWKLNKISDQFGNYLTIDYFNDVVTGENYPTYIRYSWHSGTNQLPYSYVQFQYESRPDTQQKYLSGKKFSTTKRLKNILMYADNQLAWDYEFDYALAPSTNRSRLTSIKQCDANNVCLTPIQLAWQNGSVGTLADQAWGDKQFWGQVPSGESQGNELQWFVDVTGDSLPDLVYQKMHDNIWDYRMVRNTGTGFAADVFFGNRQHAVGGVQKRQWFEDMNGDGLADLVFNENNNAPSELYVKLTNPDGTGLSGDSFWGASNFPVTDKPSCGEGGSNFCEWITDLNGDLLPDYLYGRGNTAGNQPLDYYAKLNTGSGFGPDIYWGSLGGEVNQARQLADINGDGMTDLLFRNYYVLSMTTRPSGGFNPQAIEWNGNINPETNRWFTDLNADGLTDFIYSTYSGAGVAVNYYAKINHGEGDLTIPENFWGTRGLEAVGEESFTDINGDGLMDLMYHPYYTPLQTHYLLGQPSGGFGADLLWGTKSSNPINQWNLDINGDGLTDEIYQSSLLSYRGILASGVVPDLLTQITHGYGSQTNIMYAPLTNPSVYTKDSGNIFPAMNLTGPMYVVSSYQTSDGIGGTSTVSYKYAGLKADTRGRGLYGFRQIEVTDQSTGIKSTTTYRQDFPYKTLPLQKDVRLSNGTLISREQNTWNGDLLTPYGNYFIFQDINVQSKYDLQGNLLYTITTNKDYDGFGNVTVLAITRSDGWNETTTNTYTNDTTNWLLGRLTNSTVVKSSSYFPTQTRQSSFSYYPTTGVLQTENIEPNHATLRLTKSYLYDVYGNMTQQTISGPGIVDRVQSTTYDARGQFPTSTTNPLNQTASTVYSNKFGTLLSQTDPNNLTTSFEYDGFGRVLYEHRPDGTHKRTLYFKTEGTPPTSAYHVLIDETGRAPSEVHYDMLDREIRQVVLGFNGQWIYVTKRYDNLGRLQKVSEPYFLGSVSEPDWTENQYDVVGRVTQMTAPGNRVTTIAYDGLRTTTTNPLNQTSQSMTNSLGKTVWVKDANNAQLTYSYDNFGNLVALTDPMNNVTSMQYDVRGNKTLINDPDSGTTTFVYDTLGQVTSQTDAKGQTITFDYDKLGRLRQRNSSAGIATWEYDVGANAIGKLTKSTSETRQIQQLSYDNVGRLNQTTTNIPEVGFWGNITRGFDSSGRLSTLTYPTGFSVNYLYNPRGYLEKVTRAGTNQMLWWAKVQNARGQLEQFDLGNGLTSNRTFDPITGFMTRIQTGNVQDLGFTFDAIGNLEQRKDFLKNLTEDFDYDELNRLKKSQVVGQAAVDVAYDSIGNITSMTNVGSYVYGAGSAGPHAVTSITGTLGNQYSYDLNGNRIADNASTIAYDTFNKTSKIVGKNLQTGFAYDADHNLYYESVNSIKALTSGTTGGTSTAVSLRNPNKKKIYVGGLFERHYLEGSGLTGTTQKDLCYLQAGTAVFGIYVTETGKPDKTLYLHKDHLGSIQAITDQNANIVETQSYDAWGNRRNAATWTPTINPVPSTIDRGFTGHEHLPQTNLINMGGRVYDSKIGRFLSPDPYVQAPENLQNLNRYSYVLNNPLSYTDPSGFFFKKLFKSLKAMLKNPASLVILAVSIYTGYWVSGQVLTSMAGSSATFATASASAVIASAAAGGFASGLVSGALSGQSLSDTLRGSLKSAVLAAAMAGVAKAFESIQTDYFTETNSSSSNNFQNNQIAKLQKQYLKIGNPQTSMGQYGKLSSDIKDSLTAFKNANPSVELWPDYAMNTFRDPTVSPLAWDIRSGSFSWPSSESTRFWNTVIGKTGSFASNWSSSYSQINTLGAATSAASTSFNLIQSGIALNSTQSLVPMFDIAFTTSAMAPGLTGIGLVAKIGSGFWSLEKQMIGIGVNWYFGESAFTPY